MKFNYEEFRKYEQIEDKDNPFLACYKLPNGHVFYVEPVFHLKMEGVKQFHEDRFNDLLSEIDRLVNKNKKIIFTGADEEDDIMGEGEGVIDDTIYLTIQDVCNPIHLYMEDKSRGSDYGD